MPSSSPADKEADSLDRNEELRRVINQAVGAVQGRQTTESFYALTYEELADAQIKRISDKGTDVRPNEIERVKKVQSDLLSLIAQVRALPPESFIMADSSRDVNTPVVPTADL